MSHMGLATPVGDNSQHIWVLLGESDRYRTRQVVMILVRWIQIQLELVRWVATHRTNTLPAILCQRAPVKIQTRSESSGATFPFPLRDPMCSSLATHDVVLQHIIRAVLPHMIPRMRSCHTWVLPHMIPCVAVLPHTTQSYNTSSAQFCHTWSHERDHVTHGSCHTIPCVAVLPHMLPRTGSSHERDMCHF